ncbi:hypothetical protein [Tropicibacter naphthalenivorans]|uniref:Uncharacterized protein n=1 Tax=Tropicibacter naphthalenivorans TaxID=441103 RepID=A0A0N7M1A2_9RHOB|nr:hypothetical protein [Tropicibacter naphthalenivorans]CUH82697.1 hypothetical protein TRN7648_04240 [Tropicibacter naphthalenivorans]SMD11659.1 hypothetical protein SAMN04488093_1277 [Tropicibacter naphthalenivorans]
MAQKTKDIALLAAMEFAALRDQMAQVRHLMSSPSMAAFDRMAAGIEEFGYFGNVEIQKAYEFQQCLSHEIDMCGGAPITTRSDEGDLIWLGGTEESRKLAKFERHLAQYVCHARHVSIALSAEVAMQRRRAELLEH